jgi:hypothetical protein
MRYSDFSHLLESFDFPLPRGGCLQHPFPREPFAVSFQLFLAECYINGARLLDKEQKVS